jgi:alpha-glucosidase
MSGIDASDKRLKSGQDSEAWWRDAIVYQVYIRSFADGNGDGTGDIPGLLDRLPYLKDLGVDALWINPWYPSPMADSGYDVSDYRDINPMFGTLEDADKLIAEAHRNGQKIILDIVPNHSSDEHPFFLEALKSPPGSPARDLYYFRDGLGTDGSKPPNNWQSVFGGPAWTRVPDGQWYLHLFAPGQPDFNWTNADVRADFEKTLRFWFDRGVDGFRIDVAHGLAKIEGLPDLVDNVHNTQHNGGEYLSHPHWNVASVHDIYRGWRAIADSYDDKRIFVAEAWVDTPDDLVRYLRPDELHTAFNFDFLLSPWLADNLRRVIDHTLATHKKAKAPSTWVLSNHDVIREVSRYARPQDVRHLKELEDFEGLPKDLDLGRRRARAAALLMLALPGGAYIYQGEELGLPEVEDLPDEARQDPTWEQSDHKRRGRDGCRVPLPWSGAASPFGFSTEGSDAEPWLPMPDYFKGATAEDQLNDPDSMLRLYHAALRLRRDTQALGDGDMEWDTSASKDVLLFYREPGFGCIANLSDKEVDLPKNTSPLLSSSQLNGSSVPPDTTVWFRR